MKGRNRTRKEKGDEEMTNKRRNPEESAVYVKIILPLIVLLLLATVTFWGTFFLTLIVINAIPVYGLSLCVPAIFSAFITGFVLIYVVKESVEK